MILDFQVFDPNQWYLVPNIAVVQPFSQDGHIDARLRLLHLHLALQLLLLRVDAVGEKRHHVHSMEAVAAAALVTPDLAPMVPEQRLGCIILGKPLVAPLLVVGALGIKGLLSHGLCVGESLLALVGNVLIQLAQLQLLDHVVPESESSEALSHNRLQAEGRKDQK